MIQETLQCNWQNLNNRIETGIIHSKSCTVLEVTNIDTHFWKGKCFRYGHLFIFPVNIKIHKALASNVCTQLPRPVELGSRACFTQPTEAIISKANSTPSAHISSVFHFHSSHRSLELLFLFHLKWPLFIVWSCNKLVLFAIRDGSIASSKEVLKCRDITFVAEDGYPRELPWFNIVTPM